MKYGIVTKTFELLKEYLMISSIDNCCFILVILNIFTYDYLYFIS